MNVLIVGGSGFIGTHLTRRLVAEGHGVRIFDRAEGPTEIDTAVADLRDYDALRKAMAGVGCIYHLAAEHRDDVRPTSLYHEVNVEGTRNVIRAAVEEGVDRIVFTSTVAVYGLGGSERDESASPSPFNPYGQSKLEAEAVLREWEAGSGSRSLHIVRPTVVFGEGHRGNVSTLINQLRRGRFLMVGAGRNRKSMCYVGNLVEYLTRQIEAREGPDLVNFVDKPDLSMAELVDIVCDELGRSPPKGPGLPYWAGLGAGYVFDLLGLLTRRTLPVSSQRIRKFCAETRVGSQYDLWDGDGPPTPLEQGLRSTIRSTGSAQALGTVEPQSKIAASPRNR